jgi:hypothetical protein
MPSETDLLHAADIAALKAEGKHTRDALDAQNHRMEAALASRDQALKDALEAIDRRNAASEARIETLLRSRDLASRLGMTIIYGALMVAAAVPWQGRDWAVALISLLFPHSQE